MKRLALALLLLAVCCTPSFASEPDHTDPLVQKLLDMSVTIKTPRGQGSGVLFNRKVGNDTVTFVWTVGHVVENLRKTRSVITKGSPKVMVEFEDAQVVQEFTQSGRRVGEVKMNARVIRYSDADEGEDLALLQIRKMNFTSLENGATFYLDEKIPAIGTQVFHVGSLLGQVGANSLTDGIISQIGRVLELGANGVVFDQTTAAAFPGSSGGGVYLHSDGRYMGTLVRSAGSQFNLIVPVRRLRDWAKSANVEWAVNPAIPMPSFDELKKLPIED